jgi:hypothetical protein
MFPPRRKGNVQRPSHQSWTAGEVNPKASVESGVE